MSERDGAAPPAGRGPTPRARPGELPLAALGCDFRVASAAWRAAAVLDPSLRQALLAKLQRAAGARGLVVLETCNRVEWLIDAPDPRWAGDLARAAMLSQWRAAGLAGALPEPTLHVGVAAVRHLARVVVGLESFVVGEREIAGQLNRALDEARQAGLSSPGLNALQGALGRAVRAVERGTAFRAHGRGVHSLAVRALQERVSAGRGQIVVAGMGEIGRKVAGLAERQAGWRVDRVNRTVDAAHAGAWRPWSALPALLAEADALVVATGARAPVVGAQELASRGAARPALLVIDLGASPQVEAGALRGAALLGLDDLLQRHGEPPPPGDHARVDALVEDAVTEHRLALAKRGAAELLRAIWDSYDEAAWRQLPALLDAHAAGLSEEGRRALEGALRDVLRDQSRRVVGAIATARGSARAGD
jgi:glutamyl-tRNA reductase